MAAAPPSRPRKSQAAKGAGPAARRAPGTPAEEPAAPAAKPRKPPREKSVKGSYKIPKADYALFAVLKERAAATGRRPRKNDLIRAGLQALMESGRVELRRALDRLTPKR